MKTVVLCLPCLILTSYAEQDPAAIAQAPSGRPPPPALSSGPARTSTAEVSTALANAQAQLERAYAVITAFLQATPVETTPTLQLPAAGNPVPTGAPPPPRFNNPIAPPSGANLGAAAGANLSGRASMNLSSNASVPAGGPATLLEPPPPATAVVHGGPGAGIESASASSSLKVNAETLQALQMVKRDMERLLPVLASLNRGNPNLAGALPLNSEGTSEVPLAPTGRPTGRPAPPGGLRIQPGP